MIIDFRYHIASLVAIFIALALGILIGSTLVGEDFVENLAQEQKLWIGRLEQDYLSLKRETENLRVELADKQTELVYYKNFLQDVKPYLVNDKLNNKRFAIIEMDETVPFQNVINTLEQSGASIISSTRLNLLNWTLNDYKLEDVYEQIGNLIIDGEYSDLIEILEKKGILKSIGNYGETVDGVILITSNQKKDKLLEEAQNHLIDILQYNIPIYVIQQGNSNSFSSATGFSEICTVNNLDTIPGQVSLILSIFEKNNGFAEINSAELKSNEARQ